MIYAVIDTNVFVSSLLSSKDDTATVKVIQAFRQREFKLLFNQEILDEYKDVLFRPKLKLPHEKVSEILELVKEEGVSTIPVHSEEYFPDPQDIVFYEVALSKEGAFLVTGNLKHFPKTPIVVTPTEMLEILWEQKNR